jgi:hypothetical protein
VRSGAMASRRYRDRPEVERKFVRLELIGGYLSVAGKALCLLLAATLGIIAVVQALHTSEWHLTLGAGSASAIFAGLAIAIDRQQKK